MARPPVLHLSRGPLACHVNGLLFYTKSFDYRRDFRFRFTEQTLSVLPSHNEKHRRKSSGTNKRKRATEYSREQFLSPCYGLWFHLSRPHILFISLDRDNNCRPYNEDPIKYRVKLT